MAASLFPGSFPGLGTGFQNTAIDAGGTDEALQRALQESAKEGQQSTEDLELQRALRESVDEDADLQRALRESAQPRPESCSLRRLIGPEGPFFPAGIANSGNSCFWNALLQVLFAATPVFRGALFQQALDGYPEGGRRLAKDASSTEAPSTTAILGRLRDLFAEMDMGLVDSIDAGHLYWMIFQSTEEADVNEQTQRLFDLLSKGPGPVKAVFSELFSGDMYEYLKEGSVRSVRTVPLDFCQLDLCVTQPTSLEEAIKEHTQDVQGSVVGRSYRLPPVLWLNLDRFVFDRETLEGKKRQVRLTFPDVLNAWMLVPPEAQWVTKLREHGKRREEIQEALQANREAVARYSPSPNQGAAELAQDNEEVLLSLVERQEALNSELQGVEVAMRQLGEEQELLYQLQAVIVHRGRVDTGHYFAYTRSPCSTGPQWCYLNDSTVEFVSTEEMLRVCECRDNEEDDAAPPTSTQLQTSTVSEFVDATQTQASTRSLAPPALGESSSPKSKADAVQSRNADADDTNTPSVREAVPNPSPKVSASPRTAARAPPKRQGLLSSVSSMFGCLQKPAVDGGYPGETECIISDSPQSYPASASTCSAAAPGGAILQPKSMQEDETTLSPVPLGYSHPSPSKDHLNAGLSNQSPPCPSLSSTAPPATQDSSSASQSHAQTKPRKPADVTAARCLVYVRSSIGGDQLLGEVKRRVPAALQESIDARNLELMRSGVDRVVDDFARCMRRFSIATGPGRPSGSEDESTIISEELEDALKAAARLRTEGGMGRARIYLLRQCWRRHIPWLPDELCPTMTPPDYRMYYGSSAKAMLLDALIKHGQHDVASLIVAETEGLDAFISDSTKAWFSDHGF